MSRFFTYFCLAAVSLLAHADPALHTWCPTTCTCSDLDLNCNDANLTSIPQPPANNTTAVANLYMGSNEFPELHANSFVGFPETETIMLVMSKIEVLDVEAFAGLTLLREVDLSDNYISYIYPDTFTSNPNLETVSLSGNPLLQVLDSVPILNAPNLLTLDLSYCALFSLSEQSFSQLTNLRSLDLQSNDLATLTVATLNQMPDLVNINLSNNRWNCDCGLINLLAWVAQKNSDKEVQSPKPVRCFVGSEEARKFWSVARGVKHCQNEVDSEIVSEKPDSNWDMRRIPDIPIQVQENLDAPSPESTDDLTVCLDCEDHTEKEMVFGNIVLFLGHNVDSVYLIIIVAIVSVLVVVLATLLIRRALRNDARRAVKDAGRKHNLILAFSDQQSNKRNSFMPLLDAESPIYEGETPFEQTGRSDLPPSLYSEYINSAPEHLYQAIR